jgi:hypothetical protein
MLIESKAGNYGEDRIVGRRTGKGEGKLQIKFTDNYYSNNTLMKK